MSNEVFLDTTYAIALASATDQLHGPAIALAEQIERRKVRLVTTRAVCLEIGNALAKLRYRVAAVQLLASLESDPTVQVIPLSEELYVKAFKLYTARADKEWGMIDCVSFITMRERGIRDALTADQHFEQAGFHALLRVP